MCSLYGIVDDEDELTDRTSDTSSQPDVETQEPLDPSALDNDDDSPDGNSDENSDENSDDD